MLQVVDNVQQSFLSIPEESHQLLGDVREVLASLAEMTLMLGEGSEQDRKYGLQVFHYALTKASDDLSKIEDSITD